MTVYRRKLSQSRLLCSETDCHEDRQAALRFTAQNTSLTTRALHFETALRHAELQTAQLQKSFDHRSEYLALEFDGFDGPKSGLQAEADSLRTELAEKRHSTMQVGAPHAGGIGAAEPPGQSFRTLNVELGLLLFRGVV